MARLTAESFNIDRLRNTAGRTIYDQGEGHYKKGLVQVDEVSEQSAICFVNTPRFTNRVEIWISEGYLRFHCDCRYAARGLICDHDVAAALSIRDYLRSHPSTRWKSQLGQVLQSAREQTRRASAHPYLLFFSLQQNAFPGYSSWKIVPYTLQANVLPVEAISPDQLQDSAALKGLIESSPELTPLLKNPYNPINPERCANCPPEVVVLANILIERARAYPYYYTSFPLADYLALAAATSSPIFLGSAQSPLAKTLCILPQAGEAHITMKHDDQGLHLNASIDLGQEQRILKKGDVEILCSSPLWALYDRYLFKVENGGKAALLSHWLTNPEVDVPPEDESEFLERYYLPLAEHLHLEGDLVSWEEIEADPTPRLYLSDNQGTLKVDLRIAYGLHELPYDLRLPNESLSRKADSWTLVRVHRRPDREERFFNTLSSNAYGLKRAPKPAPASEFQLRARVNVVDFLLHYIPRLTKDGFEVYGEEQLKNVRVNRSMPSISFHVSSGIDWFDVKTVINFGDLQVSLKDVRRVLRKRERYVKLADGTIGEIPEEWIERYRHLFGLGEDTGEGVRLSNHHLTLIDQLLAGADRASGDAEFERRRQRLRDFSGIRPKELPRGFTGELRPYQKAGYDWLHFLKDFDFGGCLADDMGLGKTIQALVFLQSLYEDQPAGACPASLVVVPRSLLINWQREAERFTPNLRILEYFEPNRSRDSATFEQQQVIITTYGVMLRDIERLRKYTFNYIVLDESQSIKNPLAQTAKAARLLNAHHRLVLSGTPIENSTTELWSQFAFLNPGLLGSLDYFKTEFITPIEKKGDVQAAQFLRKMVYPFILRRTKDQVAPELPPRSERILFTEMEPAQRKLYARTRDYYRGVLMGMLESEGLNNTRMKILEGLLRLRQISNHPHLVDDKFRGDSGKFELLIETLETLRAEGHKALVFSQFVQMLRLVRRALDERKIPYAYLDGHTQDRQARVDAFQQDDRLPFFLISLKAGGLGLNLTAADYVIHIDPWWNPAVEMQATDRTHRIGQDKPVFVYKLITRDSVEEKILQLQERKRSLVDQLITTEESVFKNLTVEDVRVLFS